MPIIKRTVFDRIELGNPIGIRLQKQLYDTDEDKVLSFEYHRASVGEGSSVLELLALVNANLADAYGYPPAPTDVAATIEAHRELSKSPGSDLVALMSKASQNLLDEADAIVAAKQVAVAALGDAIAEKDAALTARDAAVAEKLEAIAAKEAVLKDAKV